MAHHPPPHHLDFHPHHHHDPNAAFPNPVPFSVRKRAWQHSNPRDNFENPNHAKLYVKQVSRTATDDVIRSLFGQFGEIVEVYILKDKLNGGQQGNCFVKYSTLDAAERAIRALNCQHYFPGEPSPIVVRFADGERERLGLQDRLYVCGIHPDASNEDIAEIFSPYGHIEDIYIMKPNRGTGFVKFSSGVMALAAIKALNGTFVMRGCAQPLIVRFADPKRPREIERRGNYVFSSAPGGPYSHEPVRPVSDHSGSNGGQNFPNAAYPVQQVSQPPIPYLANQEPLASTVMQPTFPPLRPPLQLSRMPLQQTQITPTSSQSSQVAVTEMQKLHLPQSPGQILGQQQGSQTFSSNSTSSALPSSHEITDPLECDWSEHTCPDGYKYYYNCETCESKWDKPEEFALFEKQLQTQAQPNNPSHHLQSVSLVPSTQIVCQNQQELNQVQLQSETSPVVGPTCV
ncbi:PREDICTED: flowering time control protein FCA [Fragaria vesca subsp. vesca]|uniref:flowering time control protein FCA n=1 Tax=Fragaria vesca subsp. vesca TaxID=101020 RepID=UPI0002C33E6C|nr:PREDICTED: flowering time control protein FCA [Fragaria vesca subsp. vesca]